MAKINEKRSSIDHDTGLDVKCCCCLEFKSRQACTYNAEKLDDEGQKCCNLDKYTRNIDGSHKVCNDCKQTIKARKIPKKAERDYMLHAFPQQFLTQFELNNKELNKLEQFLLKLVIPFIRVAHCETSYETLKVRGNMICISADVPETMLNIIPRPQNILPVAFKRKLEYRGHYLAEFIDKEKVRTYFNWFKLNNPLFENITSSLTDIDLQQLEDELRSDATEAADTFEKSKQSVHTFKVPEELDTSVEDEIDLADNLNREDDDELYAPTDVVGAHQEHPTIMVNKYVRDPDLITACNKVGSLIVLAEKETWFSSEIAESDDICMDSDEFGPVHEDFNVDPVEAD